MDVSDQLEALRSIDPDALSEAELRAFFPQLLSLCEKLASGIPELETKVRQLENDVNRLKGEHGSRPRSGKGPGARPGGGVIHPIQDHSSEVERRSPKPWKKGKKREALVSDREEPLHVPREGLPADVVSKGIARYVVQDLVVRRETVVFLREKLYSPSLGRTWLAPLPKGYIGTFGPGLRALALQLAYGANVSFPQIHGFFTQHGIQISRGTVSNLLTRGLDALHREAKEILRAGLESSHWHGLDVTATPVGGEWHACHTIGNHSYTAYRTTRQQTRMEILATLRGGCPAQCLLSAEAFGRMAAWGVGPRIIQAVRELESEASQARDELETLLGTRWPRMGKKTREAILDAAEIAAYRADPEWPAVSCLLVDDAAQLRELTEELALCWVHDGRHYKKLQPQFLVFERELKVFRKRYWEFYRELLAYRDAPSAAEAERLEASFDELFSTKAAYVELGGCIERSQANKAKLLMVLRHPELPLHNNDSELAARRRVVKRRVSHGPKTATGAAAWDTLHTVAATAAKQGISFAEYLADRVRETMQVPWLPHKIRSQAQSGNLNRSWGAA